MHNIKPYVRYTWNFYDLIKTVREKHDWDIPEVHNFSKECINLSYLIDFMSATRRQIHPKSGKGVQFNGLELHKELLQTVSNFCDARIVKEALDSSTNM